MPARNRKRFNGLRGLSVGAVRVRGRYASVREPPFLPNCGSRLFSFEQGAPEMEIKLGTLDEAPSDLPVQYELWTKRREHWLPPIAGAGQYDEDRPRV